MRGGAGIGGEWMDNYRTLLRRIHRHLRPRTYVEIGVGRGGSLSLALPETVTVGIDPAPQIKAPTGPRVQLFRMTSDEFFARHTLTDVTGGLPLDLAFIDGMHHFEFALRDFANVERSATPTTTVLVHDCYPPDARSAARDRSGAFWAGDVWRLIVGLKEVRPDLLIRTAHVRPSGLGIIRHLDPSSRTLLNHYDAIVAWLGGLDYGYLQEDKTSKLNRIDPHWPTVRALLGNHRSAQ